MEPQRPYLSVNEIADLLGVHQRTVHRLIKDKVLPAHLIGKEYRVARSDFEAYLKDTRTTRDDEELQPVA